MTGGLDLTPDQRRTLGEAALQWVLRYFAAAADPPVYPTIGAADLTALVTEPLPRVPQDPLRVLDEFAALAALSRNNSHPRMFGYVQSSGNFAAAVGDFLASALNQNVTSWRSAPAATTIELQVIDWIKHFIGGGGFGGGVLMSGGSAANLAGLAAALHASTGVDLNTRGVAALPGAPTIYASDRAHMSIWKAASLLGLGRDAVRLVRTTSEGRIDLTVLRGLMADDRAAGRHLICVVGNAGEVNTGAIDPLDDLADVCDEHRLWFHVDGAYGGFAAAVPDVTPSFRGLTRAHSLSLDPHKWLFAPLDAGCLLVRDPSTLRRAFSHGASYIDVVADREMSEFVFWDVSPELSRRFRALKLWFALKCHGAEAFVAAIERNLALARQLAASVDEADDFERLAPVALSIVCFRYVPPALTGNDAALNQFNRDLLVEVQRDGRAYLSNASLDGRFALRACIVNHRTGLDDVNGLVATVRGVAARLISGGARDTRPPDGGGRTGL
jgi:glutamate/tyrosine decarboxylase-like PLP-dependent enzyme